MSTTVNKKIDAKAKKYAENWLPIKAIVNGAIQLENGFKVTGVKIEPKNIFILDSNSQSNTIDNLKNLYNTIDYEFWLMVADRPVDINIYLSQLQLLFNSVTTPVLRKLIMQDMNKANMFMNKEIGVTDTEYYLLFRDKRPEIIQKRVQNLISGFASCGLVATATSNDDLRTLLDGFLNDGNSAEFGPVMSE
ncbi:MAG: hypothetical protein RSD13_06390 [Clostridium sp.]